MKTIAICNHKGGVGKTALSMAIAEGLHRKGKRTLLVDLDQQMNATQQAKIDTTDEVTVYDLLTSFDYTAKDGIKHFDGGDIIPGDVLVSNAESDMAKLDTRLTMLADAMEGIDDDYDYAIILKDWSIEPDATIHVWRFPESESDVMTSEFSLFMLGLLAKIKAGTIWKSSLFILSCLSDHQV